MATVKGDVHDIGKNIVGVVLGCNGYDVIDLGVMVPADRILDTALEQDCDVVGLSGLITPSLDEMVSVAKEMERRGIELPLLIGGADVEAAHGRPRRARVQPADGARARRLQVVGVVADLLDEAQGPPRFGEPRRSRTACARSMPRKGASRCSRFARRGRGTPIDWHEDDLADATVHGRASRGRGRRHCPRLRRLDVLLPRLGAEGRYPAILDDPQKGEVARDLYAAANELPRRDRGGRTAPGAGVYGFWPAAAEGDDIVLDGGARFDAQQQADHAFASQPLARGLRRAGRDRAPRSRRSLRGGDPRGEALADRFAAELDDYRSIMVRALADRLAEAFAERFHELARHQWYAPDEALTQADRIGERFRGIRPAYGYPACPDHSEKGRLLELLGRNRPWHRTDRVVRDDTGRERQRTVLRSPASAVLLGRTDRARSGHGLRSQGHRGRGGRALATSESRVRAAVIRTLRRLYVPFSSASSWASLPPVRTADHLDPQQRIRAADQKRAASIILRKADLPSGTDERTSDLEPHLTCSALDESDLAIGGVAKSPYWARDYRVVGSSAALYVSTADARVRRGDAGRAPRVWAACAGVHARHSRARGD